MSQLINAECSKECKAKYCLARKVPRTRNVTCAFAEILIPTEVKRLLLHFRVVFCFPFLGLTPSGLFMGLSSTLILHFRVNSLFHYLCSGGRGFNSHRGQNTSTSLSCGSLLPITRANAQWVIHGFK